MFWLKQLREWHWISSAVCLICLIGFAFTGVTLNHAGQIKTEPKVTHREAALPAPLLKALNAAPGAKDAPLPPPVQAWIRTAMKVDVSARAGEWSDDEVYVALPRPGGDASLTLDRATGAIAYENTSRGWLSYLNDLHKGRNAGPAWGWFIDIFAVACLTFSITGLFLLHLLSATRRITWPLVGLGVAIPAIVAIVFIHQ